MQIDKAIQLEDGKVSFEGLLSPVELDVVLNVGMAVLLQSGALYLKDPEPQVERSDDNT